MCCHYLTRSAVFSLITPFLFSIPLLVLVLLFKKNKLTGLNRNMAVLASVQDRVEAWNKSVKMPQLDEDSGKATRSPDPINLDPT